MFSIRFFYSNNELPFQKIKTRLSDKETNIYEFGFLLVLDIYNVI